MTKPVTVKAPGELLPFLFATWPETKKTRIRSLLKHQSVTVNGEPVTQFNHPLLPGDVVSIRPVRYAAPKSSISAGIKVWFEDAHLIVIDKPSGLLSVASTAEDERTAYFQITNHLRGNRMNSRERVWIVHRLDKETSGLMVFAKTPEAKEFLQGRWEENEKHYEAVIEGRLRNREGIFACDLDESNKFKVRIAKASELTRHAITHYRVLAEDAKVSLVHLRLETGRRHQIRVQLAAEGCPIIGDEKYGAVTDPAGRLGLHATFLKFFHPATREEMRFTSPLPRTLNAHAPSKTQTYFTGSQHGNPQTRSLSSEGDSNK
ncbi:MAG: RluA family pseudouridine synthase [Terrimicrobiaceae bacterium]